MAEKQPESLVEGATTGDIDDELPTAAKSAEDRKAQAALSSLDTRDVRDDDSSTAKDVDQEAVRKAMDRLTSSGKTNGNDPKASQSTAASTKPTYKIDPAHIECLIQELELPKAKATEMLKAHEGDIDQLLRAYVNPTQHVLDAA